jgi:hypothetical protein
MKAALVSACLVALVAVGVIGDGGSYATATTPLVNGGPTAQVRRQGILVMHADNSFYDLDSVAPDWDHVSDELITGWENITYAPREHKPSDLQIGGNVALLRQGTPWTARTCLKADYSNFPSSEWGYAPPAPGNGMCVETYNSDIKMDGCHLVLLIVKARTTQSLTLHVTVWDIRPPGPGPDVTDWC